MSTFQSQSAKAINLDERIAAIRKKNEDIIRRKEVKIDFAITNFHASSIL